MQRENPLLLIHTGAPPNGLSEAWQTQNAGKAGNLPMRFVLPRQDINYRNSRLSTVFEHSYKFDRAVLGVMANGFTTFGDLSGARLSDVFRGVECSFKQRREFIQLLRDNARISISY